MFLLIPRKIKVSAEIKKKTDADEVKDKFNNRQNISNRNLSSETVVWVQ